MAHPLKDRRRQATEGRGAAHTPAAKTPSTPRPPAAERPAGQAEPPTKSQDSLPASAAKALRRAGVAAAGGLAERAAFPLAYALARRGASPDGPVLFIEDASSLMPPELEAAFLRLQEGYEADARFRGLARAEGIGRREYMRRRLALAREMASARAVVVIEGSPITAHLRPREGTLFLELPAGIPANLQATPDTTSTPTTPGTSSEPFEQPSPAGTTSPTGSVPATSDAPSVLAARQAADGLARQLGLAPKPPVHERMAARSPQGPDVTVVVPAYNAAATLPRAVGSVLAQDYPPGRVELVVVDDCSSDGTWEALPGLLSAHPGPSQLLRTPCQSGTPAAPRNLGLAAARGEYVLLLDADDWLGPEALRRMLGHALDWGSDVLLFKLVGEGGREVPRSMFAASQPEADVYASKVMWTLSPLKLFRRSLVEGIRFPEGCMPEDIEFALRAYVAAGTVSVAADYPYYHVSAERGDSNASVTTWDDVESNLRAYGRIFGFIAQGPRELRECKPLMRRLFGRDVANTLATIARMEDADRADAALASLVATAGGFYDPEALAALPDGRRRLLAAAFEAFR